MIKKCLYIFSLIIQNMVYRLLCKQNVNLSLHINIAKTFPVPYSNFPTLKYIVYHMDLNPIKTFTVCT